MSRNPEDAAREPTPLGSFADRSAMTALTLVLIAFGVYATPLIELAREAVASFGAVASTLGAAH